MAPENDLDRRLSRLRGGHAYRNYLRVRGEVLRMKAAGAGEREEPSAYWREELANFEYMLDASPLIVDKLRHHTFHVTGIRTYEYRTGAVQLREGIADKLAALKEADRAGLQISEPRELGGFGFEIDGRLYNVDTLKFYEALIALENGEILERFRDGARHLLVEVGSGWGGFAYHFRRNFPNTCYVIVDLPELFLFSGVYLATLFPEARTGFWNGSQRLEPDEIREYDFFFVPNTALADLDVGHVEIGVNMVSFQEMTTEQVEGYVSWFYNSGCPFLYSLNRDRSRYNPELTSVRAIMEKHYWLHEIPVLPVQYTNLATRDEAKKRAEKGSRRREGERDRYRHVIGWRRLVEAGSDASEASREASATSLSP